MFTEDDTLNAERIANSQNENEKQNERKTGQALKTAASFVAGGAAGAAASFATNAFAKEPAQQEGIATNEAAAKNEQPETAAATPAPSKEEHATPQQEESKAEHHNDIPSPTPKPEPNSTKGPEPEVDDFFERNDVEINRIVTNSFKGEVRHSAVGQVNGHEAMFIDDGHGNVETVYIDENDNNFPDKGEFYDAKGSNLKMSHLAEHMETADDNRVPVVPLNDDTEDEVKVITVVEDVDFGGTSVNVAVVTINDDETLLVDATKNGEVDAIIHDDNGDGAISKDEVRDVREDHIPMPKPDEPEYASDELPNYSSDDDIITYDV